MPAPPLLITTEPWSIIAYIAATLFSGVLLALFLQRKSVVEKIGPGRVFFGFLFAFLALALFYLPLLFLPETGPAGLLIMLLVVVGLIIIWFVWWLGIFFWW